MYAEEHNTKKTPPSHQASAKESVQQHIMSIVTPYVRVAWLASLHSKGAGTRPTPSTLVAIIVIFRQVFPP